MDIIKDNDQLLAYIPNVVTAVEGEDSLFTKLTPYLTVTESWLYRKVCKAVAIHTSSEAEDLARCIVATEAFRMAVPSLNLILTANGFGIVSNSTVAPASKDRTDSLQATLVELRDSAIEQLALLVDGKCTQFSGTVFRGYDAQRMQGRTARLFELFTEQRSAIFRLQATLAEEVLSDEVLHQMTDQTYHDESELDPGYGVLFAYVPGILVKQLKDEPSGEDIRKVVHHLRTHPEYFPNWAESHAAKHWQDYTYKNDKKRGGIWL